MMRGALLTALAAALLAGATAWRCGCFDGEVEAATGPSTPPATTSRDAATGTDASTAQAAFPAEPEPAAPAPTDPRATMLLPDGSRVATLNGATSVRPLQEVWPKNRPWSPIVGVERSDVGVEWYVHADGCRSTTEMRWRADLGRDDAVTRVAQPMPADAKPVTTPPR